MEMKSLFFIGCIFFYYFFTPFSVSASCQKEAKISICLAIQAQGKESIAKKEGLLQECSFQEAREIISKCQALVLSSKSAIRDYFRDMQ